MHREPPLARVKRSFRASAANIVFGMEDGTVSIFGLVFGVAATTSDGSSILIAGASGAAAAAVAMMAGAYLQVETARDSALKRGARSAVETGGETPELAETLRVAGLDPRGIAALVRCVKDDDAAAAGLVSLLKGTGPESEQNPLEQSLWMLVADFFSAAVPILPFAIAPVAEARYISVAVTLALLVALGAGRARVAGLGLVRTIAETVLIGLAAALAGVGIGLFISHVVARA
jgi:VIT1/CCC1 family predicted Fe2+/Mn2+ transporter